MKQQGYTKVPDLLIDTHLPQLSEAELKTLLIIIRQTIGWNKKRDRISHSQFKQKTGLSIRSITSAIASLFNRHFVNITNKQGKTLPASKRRYQHNIYYEVTNFNAIKGVPINAELDTTQRQNLPITIYSLNRQQKTENTIKENKKTMNQEKILKQSDQERITCLQNKSQGLSCPCVRCL